MWPVLCLSRCVFFVHAQISMTKRNLTKLPPLETLGFCFGTEKLAEPILPSSFFLRHASVPVRQVLTLFHSEVVKYWEIKFLNYWHIGTEQGVLRTCQ